MARQFVSTDAGFSGAFEAILGEPRGEGDTVREIVRDIITDVRRRGGAAVRDCTDKFDHLSVDPERFQSAEVDLDALAEACPED